MTGAVCCVVVLALALARWCSTRTCTDSAICVAPRGLWSRWQNNSLLRGDVKLFRVERLVKEELTQSYNPIL